MYLITFLRHGESEGNALGLIQGQSDPNLTETGAKQAQSLAETWKTNGQWFHQIISSPLKRARQTAQAVVERIEAPIVENPIWMERCFGDLEGKSIADIRKQNPPVNLFDPGEAPAKGAETMLDLYLRASQGLQEILNGPEGVYLVVSHGAILNMALYYALGLPLQNGNAARFNFGNTGYARLRYEPEKHMWWVLDFTNPAGNVISREEWEREAAPAQLEQEAG
jgi:2,3-bisphosphoglycerate-dependent phosphoglycerate mutase